MHNIMLQMTEETTKSQIIMVINTSKVLTGSCIYNHDTRSLTIFHDEFNKHDTPSYIRTLILKNRVSICLIQPTMDLKEYNYLHEMGIEITFGISNNIYNPLIFNICKIIDESYFTSIKLLPQLMFYIRKNFGIFDGQILNQFQPLTNLSENDGEDILIGNIDDLNVYIKRELKTLRISTEAIKSLELFGLQEHPNYYINVKNQIGVFNFLNFTKTKMGAEKLKENLIAPLISISEIYERHRCIEYFSKKTCITEKILTNIKGIAIVNMDMLITPNKKLYNDLKTLVINFIFLNMEFDKIFDIPKILKINLTEKENEDIIILYDLLESNIDLEDEQFLIKQSINLELEQLRKQYHNIEEFMTSEATQLSKKLNKEIKMVYIPQLGFLIESATKLDDIEEMNTVAYKNTKTKKLKESDVKYFEFKDKFYYKNYTTNHLNSLGDLQTEIHLLEVKILTEINKKMPKRIILKIQEYFGTLDFLFSLFLAKERWNMNVPSFSNNGIILKEAILLNRKSNKLSIEIKGPTLITGKNCSGKTTILKLIGQYTIMAQIGSYVPGFLDTKIFTNLFTKIISIESLNYNRSSYASELLQIKDMMELKTNDSLFLVDELGRGTNEKEAIGVLQNILETFSKKYFFVNVTNFQENLKIPMGYKCFQCFGNPKFEFMGKNFVKEGIFTNSCAKDLIKRLNFSDEFIKEFNELIVYKGKETEEVKAKRYETIKQINSFLQGGDQTGPQ